MDDDNRLPKNPRWRSRHPAVKRHPGRAGTADRAALILLALAAASAHGRDVERRAVADPASLTDRMTRNGRSFGSLAEPDASVRGQDGVSQGRVGLVRAPPASDGGVADRGRFRNAPGRLSPVAKWLHARSRDPFAPSPGDVRHLAIRLSAWRIALDLLQAAVHPRAQPPSIRRESGGRRKR